MLQRYLIILIVSGLLPGYLKAQSIEFVRNDGQWDGPFSYKAVTGNGDAYLSGNNFTYVLGDPANDYKADEVHHGLKKSAILNYHAYRVSFEGAAKDPKIQASKEQSWYYNYFLGKDPSRWHSNIHPAMALDYKELYPGIDMHVASQSGNLKYEFILTPGTDPSTIQLKYDGLTSMRLKDKNLVLSTSVGEVQELRPVAFQYANDGERVEVTCNYHLSDNRISYSFPDGYDRNLSLVIDPVVVFCSFTGSSADNFGYTATYDDTGNFYAGGIVHGTGYPVTTGVFQNYYSGGVDDPNANIEDTYGIGYACDMGIIKFNPSGTTRIWATYIGGSSNDQPHSMIVDPSGNLVIVGRSYSSDFPVTSGAFDVSANGGADIVVLKLNPTATSLVGSTYLGGSAADGVNYNGSEYLFGNLKHNYGDDARSEVIVDKQGNVYLTASTKSSNFPVSSNAFQATSGGNQDAIVAKFNPTLTTLLYGTYLGGSSDDAGYVLALDTAQTHFYVGGGTQSSNFPTTGSAWHNSYQGGAADGYLVRFGNGGTYPLQKICFVGTSNEDQVYGVQVDLENNVYAMGQSLGGAFPVTSGVYSNAGSTQFVIKLDSLLTTDIFSTVYGSGTSTQTNISPVAFLVDTCQNIYISGWGGNLALPGALSTVGTTNGLPVTSALITAGTPLKATTDGSDFYFITFSKNAVNLLFAAYHGRNSSDVGKGEHVDGGTSRFDRHGVIYQAICGGCFGTGGTTSAYPTTAGSWATTNGFAGNCNEVALKIAFQLTAPDAVANASPKAKGCPPLSVQFANTSTNSISYQWNYQDGSPLDTAFQPKHIFTKSGTYNVQLVVFNPNACKIRDTTYVQIIVDSNRVTSNFNYSVLDSCGPYQASFVNTSTYAPSPGAQARTVFTWYFGDGSSYTGITPPTHNYPAIGSYTVTLVMKDTAACNYPDSIKKVVTIHSGFVKAAFSGNDSVCLNTPLVFSSTSSNATGITYYFGDGDSSKSTLPITHNYKNVGTYVVTLVAVNPISCNKTDTLKKTVRIKKLPTADFSFAPVIPVSNKPVTFTNKSVNADFYSWNFGDGSLLSSETNPVHLFRHTGTFLVCLKASSNEGCVDSVCKPVDADIHTAIDVPTAFSPNGDGSNDVLYVRGGGIETMDLKIFNRWGQKVFESNSLDKGWDGSFNAKPQPVDAYGYVLTATFIDGSSAVKKGNITLLR